MKRHFVFAELIKSADRAIANLPPCCDRPGFTYVVRDASKLVKIGHAKRSLAQRLIELQAANGSPLGLVGICRGWTTEAVLHDLYLPEREHGEWFQIPGNPVAITVYEDGTRLCMTCEIARHPLSQKVSRNRYRRRAR